MIRDTGDLTNEYHDLRLRDKNKLLSSGSDLIYAVNNYDGSLATSHELSNSCGNNSNAEDLSKSFRALEHLYNAEYQHSEGEVITWNLDKLRGEDTLEELDEMLSPDLDRP